MGNSSGESRCPVCGEPVPSGARDCPNCAGRSAAALARSRVLLEALALLAVMFLVTGFASRAYHARVHAMAEAWLARGEQELNTGGLAAAVEDFRNALFYGPDDAHAQLRLAEALIAAGRVNEARSYLDRLHEQSPGRGDINLALARLSRQQGPPSEALNYYRAAIDGSWDSGAAAQRLALRRELCEFLLGAGQESQADSEISAFAAAIPAEQPGLHAVAGDLYMRAEDNARALVEFRLALRGDPFNAAALAGAGKAAFATRDFRSARDYAARAVRRNRKDADSAALLTLLDQVEKLNPLNLMLTEPERSRRLLAAIDLAANRVAGCSRIDPRQAESLNNELKQFRAQAGERSLRRDPQILVKAMDAIFRAESAAAQACGEPTGADRALLVLAQSSGGER